MVGQAFEHQRVNNHHHARQKEYAGVWKEVDEVADHVARELHAELQEVRGQRSEVRDQKSERAGSFAGNGVVREGSERPLEEHR